MDGIQSNSTLLKQVSANERLSELRTCKLPCQLSAQPAQVWSLPATQLYLLSYAFVGLPSWTLRALVDSKLALPHLPAWGLPNIFFADLICIAWCKP